MAGESRYFYRFLDTAGDGTGIKQQSDDFSTTADFYQVDPPAQGFFAIHLMTVQIRSSGMMSGNKYGDQPELTNGITAAIIDLDDNVVTDLTDGQPVKNNADWAKFAYDARMLDFGPGSASGDQYLRVRWKFADAGQPVFISQGERFAVKLNDDFSGLISQTAQIQGFFCISSQLKVARTFRIA